MKYEASGNDHYDPMSKNTLCKFLSVLNRYQLSN